MGCYRREVFISKIYKVDLEMKKIACAFVILIVSALTSALAQNSSIKAIPGSYIVTFVPSNSKSNMISPIILAADTSDINTKAASNSWANNVPFGEHTTKQDKKDLAKLLNIKSGKVNRIFDKINAAHFLISSEEAAKLKKDPRVLSVTQDLELTTATNVQVNPGWALDRLDQASNVLNNQYLYNSDGAGRTIFILDSGLNLGNYAVASEFGGRASILYDFNGGNGYDCLGHGTQVASAAAGNTYGVAKGATIITVKITNGCTGNSSTANSITAFNWLAANAPRGTIVNWSQGFEYRDAQNKYYCSSAIIPELENAIRAAYNAGIIVVVAAGNDACNTGNYSPTRIPEAFVVGATSAARLQFNQDARAIWSSLNGGSRYGSNISVFAPGDSVATMNYTGATKIDSGTSFAAPYISGVFAVGCQAAGTLCNTMSNAGAAYTALRNLGINNTVKNADGTMLPAGTPSRFISRSVW
ncbi:MAG: hypothetical protein FGM56_04205 [Limnohabitans sp.]|nr:hypothetical protein [Limnohabitans sp.]